MNETSEGLVIKPPVEGAAAAENKNKIDPSRRFNIAPVVQEILQTRPQTPDEVFDIIHKAIDAENEARSTKGWKPLGTERIRNGSQIQDSDQQKIEFNCLVSSVLIPYYEVFTQAVAQIATSEETVTHINPNGESGFLVLHTGSDIDQMLKNESNRIAKSDKENPITKVYIEQPEGTFECRTITKTKRGDVPERMRIIMRPDEMPTRLMSDIYLGLLMETFKSIDSNTLDPNNPLTTDASFRARYAAVKESILSSRNADTLPVSVFDGGFGVGVGIYEKLYNYADDQSESQREALAQELAAMIGIPAKIANSHLDHFLDMRGKVQNAIADGSLLKKRPDSGSYVLNPNSEVTPTLLILDAKDNIVTGCPAIVQGIITKGFTDYVKLRVKFDKPKDHPTSVALAA